MFRILSFSLFFLALNACTGKVSHTKKKVEAKSSLKYAKHFELKKKGDLYQLTIIDPDTEKVKFKAILSKQKPSRIPEGYVFIQTPVKTMAVLSATQIGMLSKLEATEYIKAVSDKKYIFSSEVLKSISTGKTADLGDENNVPAEKIISSGSKYLLYSDFGSPFNQEEQLSKMGITFIPISDWREEHPLGKAEWIKLMGVLSGKEDLSDKLFKETVANYNRLKGIALKQHSRKTVLSGNMIGDSWVAPKGNSYHAILLRDAGADYLFKDVTGTGSISDPIESVLSKSAKASFWLNPGYPTRKQILMNNPKIKHLGVFNEGEIWCYSSNMNYYWEMSASEPDHVLEDLIRILHPGSLPKGKMYFYRKVTE